MPLPLFIGIGAAIAGAAGLGAGIHGGVKMKKANDTMKSAEECHKENIARFEKLNKETTSIMDKLGILELNILSSFKDFADVFEMIHNRPEFKEISVGDVTLPTYSAEELEKTSVGAGVLLGGLGGAAAGTAGGFAAAGATTAAVHALGFASTGAAIGSLKGAALTNATLALLGGGSLAAGGGGIALGTAVLGGATLGVGLLVGGIIFSITGSGISKKADEAWEQMEEAEAQINKVCDYLKPLKNCANGYYGSLTQVEKIYMSQFQKLRHIVKIDKKTDWNDFTDEEMLITENTVLLVGLLYNMCKVQIVIQSDNENEPNKINREAVNKAKKEAKKVLEERDFVA